MNFRLLSTLALLAGCVNEAEPGLRLSELGVASRESELTRRFDLLGKSATWTQVDRVTMQFPTFHTQGLVKVGDVFYVSAVEILEGTQKNGASTDALRDFTLDRSEGKGRGWLFQFDRAGKLLNQRELTDGSVYHPGGIDYDGHHLWVPVAEYRPNSRSHVYRVDPTDLRAELVLRVADHIGGVCMTSSRARCTASAGARGASTRGRTTTRRPGGAGRRTPASTSTIRIATSPAARRCSAEA